VVELLSLPEDLGHLDVVAVQPMVTDQLPNGVTLRTDKAASISTSQSATGQDFALVGGTCTAAAAGQYQSLQQGAVVCQLAQDMHPGDRVKITIPVHFSAELADNTMLVNHAMVQNGSDGFVPGVLNQGVEKDPKPANNTSRFTQIVNGKVDLAAKLEITSISTTETDCDGNTKESDYRGPGSRKLISVTMTNQGKSTANHPSFNIQRTVEAVADLSEAKINGISFDLTGYCQALATSITCDMPIKVSPGEKVNITYPITTLPSATPNSDAGYPDTLTVTSESQDSNPGNNVAYAPIRIGAAKSKLCTNKVAVERLSDVNPAVHDQINWAFQANGNFVYEITVNAPAGGHYADAQNVLVDDVMPIGLVPITATASQGSCKITSSPVGSTVSKSGTAHADADHPQYTVLCDLGTVSGNNPDGSAPTATIYIAGKVDGDAVQLYGTGVTAEGWNWASEVKNIANTTYGEARLPSTGTAVVDLIRRPTQGMPTQSHPATGVDDKFTLLIAAGLMAAGAFLMSRRVRVGKAK